MSLMKLIAKYDAEQIAYIKHLEDENASLRQQLHEASELTYKGVQASESTILQLIKSGLLDDDKLVALRNRA